MLQYKGYGIVEYWRLRNIASKVRDGIVPKGVPVETIWKALGVTKKKNQVEIFGFLSAKHYDKDGNLKADLGLQAVKKVSVNFTNYLAQAFLTSSIKMADFCYHVAGSGSTAENNAQTKMVSETGIRRTAAVALGTSSNVVSMTATITCVSAFTAIEHGVFDTVASAAGCLLDRSIVTTPPNCVTDDTVTWTYQLTISPEA